jgi:NAD(P)-dependent dehydrogenase (short-subunit alcohol dehydrogenase family)
MPRPPAGASAPAENSNSFRDLKGVVVRKQAVVIGGTSGIGRAIGERLLESGCDVVVTGVSGRNESALKPGMRGAQLDVADLPAIDAFFATLERVDVLVNSAGTNRRRGLEFQADVFEYVLRVNLLGTMRACYAAYPRMKSGGGSIVNIASMFSTFGSGSIPAYASSKAAVIALTKSLAIAWATDNIRVNAIAPGFIETKLTRDVLDDGDRVAEIVARTPMKRWGKPDDLSGTAHFLCSADAAFITGTTVTVDGGYSIF